MPWSETRAVNERARFVLEASEGWTPVSELCRRYGISRRVGYKWLKRFQRGGLSALEDRSRARQVQAGATPPEVISQILELRRAHPTWGPRKLLARMQQLKPEARWPSASTIGEILRREGVSKPRRRRAGRSGAWAPARTAADEPNRVWTADFKGEFRLGSGRLCYPLTVQDAHSRFLLGCQALPGTGTAGARATFERIFREFGLPEVIRTDNGVPFSARAVGGLSGLAVWFIRLGIRLERTRRAHPQDNGAHERMHRTLKAEAVRPVRRDEKLQQRAFDTFRRIYNYERPHEALGQNQPAQVYCPSPRPLPSRLPPLEYPGEFHLRRISTHGELKWRQRRYFLSETLVRQAVGLQLSDSGLWKVYFGPALLAELDDVEGVLRPLGGRFKPRAAHR
jgi:putative transposase